jgi:N-acetylglucosamine-6-phosphate deacetylase
MAELTGCGLAQAVRMASRTPARALDRADLGEIAPGKRASLSLFDADFSPQDVVIDGKPVA